MAADSKTYSLGSTLAHIEMCESHDLPIDIICEDGDEFICTKCAKTDHKDHGWSTLPTAGTQRRRELHKFLRKIMEEDLSEIDEKVQNMTKQITENKKLCDSEMKKVEDRYAEIMTRLTEIKKSHEKTLRDNLVRKNDQLNHMKSELDKNKRIIVDKMEFMEENNSTMSDYSLIDNQRELTKVLSKMKVHMTNCEHSVRFTKGDISDDLLEALVGKTLDLDDTSVTQTSSFKYGDRRIIFLRALCEDQCYLRQFESANTEQVNTEGENKHKYNIKPYDMCVSDAGDVYCTTFISKSISCLSPSGSVSTVISTDPLEPGGICQSVSGGLLVTLINKESHPYKLNSQSRRLVRHITVTGDVIHEYEYQEDGQTRLFTLPVRVTQNSNSDICVVNRLGRTTGNLVIMSPSGLLRSVYDGQNHTEDFLPTDVVCDPHCNILVTDQNNKQIHLLSPDGEFLKVLLTENEVNLPFSLSLYKSTLWVGYYEGLVKVFQYKL
ncbi:uncharacterized protein LOC133193001 [Saccostrea echinata]|uniref:uncharacterized protein LOC133193001 n=1 Tax=Saccostrea echinata TaxID=191078 RepID=UPI002A81681A|nr:uncharacterized protein LOC133193001 [Saccostrea echinata]